MRGDTNFKGSDSSDPSVYSLYCVRVETFEVFVSTRDNDMQLLGSLLHFLANKNAGLAILASHINRGGGHVALLSYPTVHFLYCVHR